MEQNTNNSIEVAKRLASRHVWAIELGRLLVKKNQAAALRARMARLSMSK